MHCRLRPLGRREVRELDLRAAEEFALPTLLLMENAGRGAAAWLVELATGAGPEPRCPAVRRSTSGRPATVFPGCVAAGLDLEWARQQWRRRRRGCRHLDAWGFLVRIVWFAIEEQLRGDARAQWAVLDRSGVDQTAWFATQGEDARPDELATLVGEADWLVDGLLGTGLTRPVEGVLRSVIEIMNQSGKPILALDVPSGLDADTGIPLGAAVRARATATFVGPKLGFSAPGAKAYTGEVGVIDIGLPRVLLNPFLI